MRPQFPESRRERTHPGARRTFHSARASLRAALLLCCSLTAPAQQAEAPLLTEGEAVSIALAGNRDAQKSSLDLQRADAAVREARTQYLPQSQVWLLSGYPLAQLQLTIPKGALGVYPGTGPIPGQNMQIASGSGIQMAAIATAAQPVSQLYRIHLAVDSARLQQQMAAAADREQRQKLAAQVRQAYDRMAAAQALAESDAEQLNALAETLRTVQQQMREGTALREDELQAQTALLQEQVSALHNRNTLATAREQLNQLLGRGLDTLFTVESQPQPSSSETDLDAARARALRQRPEILQADLRTRGAELDVRQERAGYIPDVGVQMSYLGFENARFISANSATLGFSLQWQNPWDWGQRKAHIAGLKDQEKQAALTAEDARQQVLLDVDRSFRALAEARLGVQAASLARDASAEKLRNLTNRYREQTVLLPQVLQQNADLEQKKAACAAAIETYWSARADFGRAMGGS